MCSIKPIKRNVTCISCLISPLGTARIFRKRMVHFLYVFEIL